jgi:cell division protein FtsB
MSDQYYRKPRTSLSIRPLFQRLGRNKMFMLALLIAVPASMFMLFSNRGIMKRMSLEADKAEMEQKVREAELEQDRLNDQSKALDTDGRAIEKVAREKYGFLREGETVYKVKKDK